MLAFIISFYSEICQNIEDESNSRFKGTLQLIQKTLLFVMLITCTWGCTIQIFLWVDSNSWFGNGKSRFQDSIPEQVPVLLQIFICNEYIYKFPFTFYIY